jgi:hypothetical protein
MARRVADWIMTAPPELEFAQYAVSQMIQSSPWEANRSTRLGKASELFMDSDTLLASTDIEDALSQAYAHAIAAATGYVVSLKISIETELILPSRRVANFVLKLMLS